VILVDHGSAYVQLGQVPHYLVGIPAAGLAPAPLFGTLTEELRLADYCQAGLLEQQATLQRGDRKVVRLVDGESGLSARTIHRRLSSISGLFGYLVACGEVESNPVPRGLANRKRTRMGRGTPLVRTPRTLPKILEPGEVDELMAACRRWRDRAMVQAMVLVPISARFFDSVARYLDAERPRDASTDRLFVVLKGPNTGKALTAKGLDQLIVSARQRAGLAHGTCHELRHTCFTRLREAGMSLEAIQAQAGHRSIESTRIYLHLANDWLANEYLRASDVIDAGRFADDVVAAAEGLS